MAVGIIAIPWERFERFPERYFHRTAAGINSACEFYNSRLANYCQHIFMGLAVGFDRKYIQRRGAALSMAVHYDQSALQRRQRGRDRAHVLRCWRICQL